MFAVPGDWQLKQCPNAKCALCWQDPAPIEPDLICLYANYFTHDLGTSPKLRMLAHARSLLYSGYLAFGYFPSSCLGITKARAAIRQMYLNGLKPGNLLDVGCGNGGFLARMQKLGWTGTGVDFDAKAIGHAKKRYGSSLTFMHTDLAGAGFGENTFDALTMSHVIEHVPDPVSLLAQARRVLKPGGRAVITTPNIKSHGHKKFGRCWWGLDSPRHLQVFSTSALANCARKAGFENITTFTTAANADTFIGGSYGFAEAEQTNDFASGNKVKFNILRGLRSLKEQWVEARNLRRDPECGEEAVLICHK